MFSSHKGNTSLSSAKARHLRWVSQLTKPGRALVVLLAAMLLSTCGPAPTTPADALPPTAAWSVTGSSPTALNFSTGIASLDRDLQRFTAVLDSLAGENHFAAYAINAGKEGLTLGLALQRNADAEQFPRWAAVRQYDFRGDRIQEYAVPGLPPLFLARAGELILMGFLPLAVEEMLGQIRNGHEAAAEDAPSAGAMHHIQTAELPALLSGLTSPPGQAIVRRLGQWFTHMDFQLRPTDSLTFVEGRVSSDLPAIGNKPAEWWALLPEGTTAFTAMPLLETQLQPAAQGAARWWRTHLQDWPGSYSLSLRTATHERLWILPRPDLPAAEKQLRDLAERAGQTERVDYLLYELRQLAIPGLLAGVWPDSAPDALPWVTLADSVVVFAESRAGLEQWLDSRMLGRSLLDDAAFKSLAIHLPNEPAAVVAYYNAMSVPALTDYFPGWSPPGWWPLARQQLHAFYPQPGSWRWQGVVGGSGKEEASRSPYRVAWRREMGKGIRQLRPVVDLQGKSTNEIALQDSAFTLNLLDGQGRTRWQLPLDGPLLSDLYRLPDAIGSTIYLAQTRQAIYQFDSRGQVLPNYPRRLAQPAAAPLTVADLDHDGNYYYFLPTTAGEIVGYNGKGEPLRFWNPRTNTGPVYQPVQHFQNSRADYILALDTLGSLRAYSRTGELRWSVDSLDLDADSRLSGQAASDGGARLVVSEQGGRLRIVNLIGQSFPLPMRAGGQPYEHFLFVDIWGDERNDYLAQAGRRLALYAYDDKGYAQRWSAELPLVADALFSLPNRKFVGILNRQRGLIYLLDSAGRLLSTEPLAGQYVPVVTQDGLLVTAYNDVVYGYRLAAADE